jgi:hypothetical protein
VYGPFEEDISVEGQLVRIGGKDRSIHGQIKDGLNYYNCEMSRSLALDLCHYLFGPIIRVSGKARFMRDRDGAWKQLNFRAIKFEELDDSSLTQVIERGRGMEGNGWLRIDRPLAELTRLRSED